MRLSRRAGLALAGAWACPGLCAAASAQPSAAPGPRVLALGGAVTETVYALGAGAVLIGTDQTSLYPAAAAVLPKVGYVRALGAEGLLSLRPDLVLASADAGPPAALAQVAAAQVTLVTLPEAHSAQGALDRVRRVGAALGLDARAEALVHDMEADLAQVAADVAAATEPRPRVLFLLSAGRGAPMAAGAATAAHALVALAGGVNAVAGFGGYRPLSGEALLLAEPDLVLTTAQTLEGVGGVSGMVKAVPGLDATPAGAAGRVAGFDALFLLGFGPRLAQAVCGAAQAVHPRTAFRRLPDRPWAA